MATSILVFDSSSSAFVTFAVPSRPELLPVGSEHIVSVFSAGLGRHGDNNDAEANSQDFTSNEEDENREEESIEERSIVSPQRKDFAQVDPATSSTNTNTNARDDNQKNTYDSAIISVADSLHGRLLCASQCAYLTAKELGGNPYFRGAGFLAGTSVKRVSPRSGIDACLLGRTIDGIVVAFRGTEGASPLEWLQNSLVVLKSVPVSFAPGGSQVHLGFYNALRGRFGKGIKKAILDLLEEDSRPNTKIYLAGHSKGGSLSSLFALMLHNDPDLPSPELVCTFGAPRVGNSVFCSYYESLVKQVTYENDLDIIPFLPPGEDTMEDIETATEDPEAMKEMLEGILWSEQDSKRPSPLLWTNYKYYSSVGKRTYIGSGGEIYRQPVTRSLDAKRIKDLEGRTLLDFRRAHCSSCQYVDDGEDVGTCSGGYFEALAPEVCALVTSEAKNINSYLNSE